MTKMKFFTKPNLKQTQIRLGQRGIPRNNEDFLKLRLANEILGGGFSSRLNQKIRDDLGLTYSIGSSIDARSDRGIFIVSTFTKNETAGKTLTETLAVFQEFVENGVNETELRAAKNLLIGQFPKVIETPDRLASTYMFLDFYGVPRSYLSDFIKNLEKISLTEVNEVIKKYYHPRNFRIVVYGDENIVMPQLSDFKPEVERIK